MRDPVTYCSHCGAAIPASARFCKHCGSSDADGWADSDESMLEDDDFDYDEFIENEFAPRRLSTRLHPVWKVAAVLVLLGFALALLQL